MKNGHGKRPSPPRPASRGPYKLDAEKTQALREKGLSCEDIAQHQGVAESTVYRFLEKLGHERKQLDQFKHHRPDLLAQVHARSINVQHLALESIERDLEEDRINCKLTPHQKKGYLDAVTIAGGVAIDKERLERGMTSANLGILGKLVIEAHQHLTDHPAISGSKDSRKNQGAGEDA